MVTIQEAQRDPLLFDKFIEENEPLVWSVIRKSFAFSFYTGESEDYFQEGCVGLIKAAKRFDPSVNVAFSTYAVPVIWGELARYRRDYSTSMLNVPRSFQDLYFKIGPLKAQGMTDEEICSTLNISEEEYNKCSVSLCCDSLNRQVSNDDGKPLTVEDVLDSGIDIAEQVTEREYLRDKLKRLKESLTEKQYNIFLYHLNGMPQSAIGKRVGISQVQVSRNLKVIIEKCKNAEEERKVVKMRTKITVAQLLSECKEHGTDKKAAEVIAERYNMAPVSVRNLISVNKIKQLLEGSLVPIEKEAVEKPSGSSMSLLKIDVMAGKEFKYKLGEELKIIKGDSNVECKDLGRLIQELQEIQRMRQVV